MCCRSCTPQRHTLICDRRESATRVDVTRENSQPSGPDALFSQEELNSLESIMALGVSRDVALQHLLRVQWNRQAAANALFDDVSDLTVNLALV